MVESVYGIAAFAAARATRISPSPRCIPMMPVGANATGMLTGCPTMVVASERFDISTATRCRSLIRLKSASLAS